MLSSAIEAVEDAYLCFDDSLEVLAVNAAAQSLFGYTAGELIGRNAGDLIRPVADGGEKEMIDNLFSYSDWKSAKADWRDVNVTTKDGSTLRVAVTSVNSSSNGVSVATALFRLISDDGEVVTMGSQTFEGAHSIRNRFLSSMSHELRTPLNAVIGFSDIIGREVLGPATPAEYAEYARDINGAAMHMLDLIRDILEYTQIERSQRSMEITPVDIAAAIRFSAGMARPIAEKANVSMQLSDLDEPILIQADERAVRQIILNLVTNAIRYNKDGGTVRITSRQEAGRGALDVEDTGIGIKTGDIDRIFEPFTTLQERPYSSQDGGVGLGLTIVRRLADAMDADITIRSIPDQGTMMTVTFPLAQSG